MGSASSLWQDDSALAEAFFAPRWDVILRLKNSGTALSGMTLRLPLDVGSGWDVGTLRISSIRSDLDALTIPPRLQTPIASQKTRPPRAVAAIKESKLGLPRVRNAHQTL